jgi:hypothetical protein
MTDGYKSRKFWFSVGLAAQATALLLAGSIDGTVWLSATGAAIGVFTFGNVAEKFAK